MPVDDDLDLSSLLRPVDVPPDGPRRARRTAQRRRIARRVTTATMTAAVTVVATVAVWALRDSPGPTVRAGNSGTTALLVVTRTFGQDDVVRLTAMLVDPANGRSRTVDLPDVEATERRVQLVPRDGGVVVVTGEDELSVWVLSPPYVGAADRLGAARRVVPSNHPGRVWLVLDEVTPGDGGAPFTIDVEEIDVRSRTTTSKVTFPCCRRLVADSALGPVLQLADGTTEVWDVARGQPAALFDGVASDPASHGSRLVFEGGNGCGPLSTVFVLDLATGGRRVVGDHCAYVGVGGWAPDGRTIGLWEPGDGAAGSLALVDVDGDQGPLRVPGSRSAAYHLAWDGQGHAYFVGELDEDSVRMFDPETGTTTVVFDVSQDALVDALAVVPTA